MAAYRTHHLGIVGCMAGLGLAEAWLMYRARSVRDGVEGMSLGEEELLDSLENHPLFNAGGDARAPRSAE